MDQCSVGAQGIAHCNTSVSKSPNPELIVQRKQDHEKTRGLEGESEDVFSSQGSETPTEVLVVTSIQATNLARGLARIPAGFYGVVCHSGLEWRTKNKPTLASDDIIEWSGPIPIPSDLMTEVSLAVYASFEFEPTLGKGERLRVLTSTVGHLLDYSSKNISFTFLQDEQNNSPCSSLLVTVKWQCIDSLASDILQPHCFPTGPPGQLEDWTDQGHTALSHYQKNGVEWDLKHAIERFQATLNICPLDHPCRAIALSNLAMAKFHHCQSCDRDAPLDDVVTLYRKALVTRPIGHPDRARTLVELSVVLSVRFKQRRDKVDEADAEALLHEVMDHSSAESHEHRAAVLMLRLDDGQKMKAVQAINRSSTLQDSAPNSISVDPWHSVLQMLHRFKQFGDLAVLQQAISILESSIAFNTSRGEEYAAGLSILGDALRYRYERLGELKDLEEAILRQQDAVDLTPEDHPDRPSRLNNLGISFTDRFQHLGDSSDLNEGIARQQDALRLTFHGHPDRPGHLHSLGNSLLFRFERFGQVCDLEEAISRQRDAADLTPDDHADNLVYSSSLGILLKSRFECFGKLSDLEEAVSRQRDVVRLIPDHHTDKPTYLSNLGGSLGVRFGRLGQISDLDEAISNYRDAIHLSPRGHPLKPVYLSDLGTSLRIRFEQLGEPSNLDEALSVQQEAVDLSPNDHAKKPSYLSNLGTTYLTRFEHLGQSSDLEDAISRQQDAIRLARDDHRKPAFLNGLGTSYRIRFERFRDPNDMEGAISSHRDAVHLTPDDHPSKPGYLSDLGVSYLTRFEHLEEPGDLDEAISRQQEALRFVPHDHPEKPSCLSNLGMSLLTRFEHLGELSDLDDAISKQQDADCLIPHGHPNKAAYLSNLGSSFKSRFECLGNLNDIEEAISRQQDAVQITPDDHPDKPGHLANLATSFFTRFERFQGLSNLDQAVSLQQEAVRLTPHDHPDRPSQLSTLGGFYLTRFEHLGELSDLDEAISKHKDAVDQSTDDSDKAACLNDLGISFRLRFERFGNLNDLEEAISMQQDAVRLTPQGHSDRPDYLHGLSNSILIRFERFGRFSDLQEAISMQLDADHLTPDNHPEKSAHLNNLGLSYRSRFEHLRDLSDLDEAISKFRNAIQLTPDDQPDKPTCLNNLGVSLETRFERLGGLTDLAEAISVQQDAVHLTPDDHPDKPRFLNNLGVSLSSSFDCLGELSDLEEAISSQQDALRLTPDDHPAKPHCLSNLGASLKSRFERFGELSDLEEAISRQLDAIRLTPDGHPEKPGNLGNLGLSLVARYRRLGERNDLEKLASLSSHAARAPTGPIVHRFRASLQWIFCSRLLGRQDLLHAYSTAILLLPQLAWIGFSLAHRYRELIPAADVVREAAAAALDSGQPEVAVEWLEQGRSVVWGEMFQLRSSYDELLSAHPDYAHRLRELSTALEYAGSTREKSIFTPLEPASSKADHRRMGSLRDVADKHQALAIERDDLLQEIWRLPGFERFLLYKDFSQLRAAAHAGPVVILNAAETRCDALIIHADVDHVIHVPLTNFTFQRSLGLQASLKSFVRHARAERDGHLALQESSDQWQPVLASLWKCVVKPVLDALAISIPGQLLRIFWCPTGPFTSLPIHAAGFYDTHHSHPGYKVFDFVVSSYTPTLGILASSLRPNPSPSPNFRLLAVPQPASDGQSPLSGVVTELEHIKQVITTAPTRITLVESSVGTVEEVLPLMKESDWVHFACHGVQDSKHPTESGLCLADQHRLRLSDMISLSRPYGGLAFLSACHTARGDEDLSDEAIHIAAGMLFAGYSGVIGTMWKISDKVAPNVAKDVYERLFSNGTRPDCQEAALALHAAVGRLRDQDVPFVDWLPFIHVGL